MSPAGGGAGRSPPVTGAWGRSGGKGRYGRAARSLPRSGLNAARRSPARAVIGERKGGSGCAPGRGVSQRRRPAGPLCRGAARSGLSVCAGPGAEPSRAGCELPAPPLPWKGEAVAAGDSAPLPR